MGCIESKQTKQRNIQNGHHDSYLEFLKSTFSYVGLNQNLVGDIRVTWRRRIAKFLHLESNIQDDSLTGHLGILHATSPPETLLGLH